MYTNTTSRAEAQGNGVATDFPVSLQVYDVSHLQVWRFITATQELALLVRGTDYNLTLNSDFLGCQVQFIHDLGGGTVVFAPPSGHEFVFLRVVPYTQEQDLRTYGATDKEGLERQLDLMAMGMSQLAEEVSRAVKVSVAGVEVSPDALLEEIRAAVSASAASAVTATTQAGLAASAKTSAEGSATAAATSAATAANMADKTLSNLTDYPAARTNLGVDTLPRRNRLCNGDLRIANINKGAAVTPSSGYPYLEENWAAELSQSGKLTFQRVASSIAGCAYAMRVTVAASYAPAAADYFWLRLGVEGFDWADLKWGTAAAKAATISFKVRVPAGYGGVYAFSVLNRLATRSYVFTKTLVAGDNPVTETIPGCTDGVWDAGAESSVRLRMDLGTGSNYQTATANTWLAGVYLSTASATKFVAQPVKTTYETSAVKVEEGTFATPDSPLPLGLADLWCQRYHPRIVVDASNFPSINFATNAGRAAIPLKARARVTPTGIQLQNVVGNFRACDSSMNYTALNSVTIYSAALDTVTLAYGSATAPFAIGTGFFSGSAGAAKILLTGCGL